MIDSILVVEDETKIAELLVDYLESSNYQAHHIANGNDVLDWVKDHKPSVILLDIMLPGKDGLTLCREIREFSNVPIVMITARAEEIDRILGLDLGADDYVCKPFSPREVISRVNALLRRMRINGIYKNVNNESELLQIDRENYVAKFNDHALTLTPAEFRLLSILSQKPVRVYSRQQLIDQLYDDGRIVTDRTIDTHIKNLRKKLLGAGANGEPITSIYGIGYKWEAL